MKCFLTCYIVYSLTALTVVRSNEDAKNQFIEFFDQIQNYNGITTRKITIDSEDTSIFHFFQSTEKTLTANAKLTITNQDVNRSAYVLHTVVSCEYSENAYYFVKLIDKKIKKITDSNRTEVVQFIRSNILNEIKDILQSMIFTLAGLLKYLKNYIFKQHEILTILLSWYISIDDYLTKKIQDSNYIESIDIANFQVERYLKQYILDNNCNDIKNIETFKNNVDGNTNTLIESNDFQANFKLKLTKLQSILNKEFIKSTMNLCILASKDVAEPLKQLLDKQVKTGVLKILYNGQNNEDLLWSQADKVTDIKSLLNIENHIILAITKIIIGYVSNILNDIMNDNSVTDIKTPCTENLIKKFDNYIKKFKDDGQPVLLINKMSIIRTELYAICFKVSDVRSYISKIDRFKIEIPTDALSNKFEEFLQELSKRIICTKLHPLISNLFWEKLYFAPTKIYNYTIDLKYLFLKIDKFSDPCSKIYQSLSQLENLKNKIVHCEKYNNENNHTEIVKCIKNLHEINNDMMNKINEIISQERGAYKNSWKILLVRLIYKLGDEESSEIDCKDTIKCKKSLENLKIFLSHVKDDIEVMYQVTCLSQSTSTNSSTSAKPEDSGSYNRTKGKPKQKKTAVKQETVFRFEDFILYENFFKTIKSFGDNLAIKSGTIIDQSIKIYMNGVGITFMDFRRMYYASSIDFMRDDYDYVRFLVKWILAMVYSKIYEIILDVEKESNTSELCEEDVYKSLKAKIKPVKNFSTLIDMPVKQILDTFVQIISLCVDNKNDNLIDYKIILTNELEKLGVVPSCIKSSINGSFSDRIDALSSMISYLTDSYVATYSFRMDESINAIEIKQDDLIMMFAEWHS